MTEPREPAGSTLSLDYLTVRARIVVNRAGDRWRATIQRRQKVGGRFAEPEIPFALAPDAAATFPTRAAALMASVLSIVEWEDARMTED